MTIHKGTINCRNLANFIHQKMLEEGYTEVSSNPTGSDGRVYRTNGVSGQNPFVIQMKDSFSTFLNFGVYETYTPGASPGVSGVFGNGYMGDVVGWNNSTSYDRHSVDYVINITRDRLILMIAGQKAESNRVISLAYIGLPKLLSSDDTGPGAAGMAYSTRGPYQADRQWRTLRDKAQAQQQYYSMDSYIPLRSYGWGNKLFYSPIYIGNAAEGVRGELDGLFVAETIHQDVELQNLDTFTKDGRNYMIVMPTVWSTYTLYPYFSYIIEI